MEGNRCNAYFCAQDPYPEVRAACRNRRYAEAMLSNLGGSNSEMSAVSLYFYNHLVTEGMPEVARAFHEISIVEMHHLEIFGTLARQLGEDPKLWCVHQGRRVWWTPDYNHYPRKLGPMLHSAAQGERAAIHKYESQIRWIRDPNIQENLRRIILDEQIHTDLLQCLYDAYVGGDAPQRLPLYYD